jgi:hypothetical protein
MQKNTLSKQQQQQHSDLPVMMFFLPIISSAITAKKPQQNATIVPAQATTRTHTPDIKMLQLRHADITKHHASIQRLGSISNCSTRSWFCTEVTQLTSDPN